MSPLASIAALRPPGHRTSLTCAYAIEGLNSISVNLLMNGIAFYTTQAFGWTTRQNLLLMMAQGVFYAGGALTAGHIAGRWSKTRSLVLVNTLLLALILVMQLRLGPALLVPLLLVFTFVSTFTWPMVESLVTEGCEARRMNRRITIYNMVWSSIGVLIIAIYGTILHYWPGGPMRIPIGCQVLALLAAAVLAARHTPPAAAVISHADPAAAAKLAHNRRVALWLARISLPASFVVANTLMGLFPTFRASPEMGVRLTTFIASLWMASRVVTFIILGCTSFWHTRPRLLLAGGVLMLLAFLAIVLPAERIGFFADWPLGHLLSVIVIAELVLGVVAGYVFSASLYFGMVLSDGSAEHGGYHEALIGAGMVLGPGLAAGAQQLSGSTSQAPSIYAVSSLLLLVLALATTVAVRARRQ